jgi:exosortase N
MMQALSLPFKKVTSQQMGIVLYLMYAVIILLSLHAYIAWQSVNVVLGLLALPLVSITQKDNCNHTRYGTAAALLAIVTILLPVKTLLFFTIAFACFFITENFIGKINGLPLVVIVLMSPVFQFSANVFSFSIRLQLTNWAGSVMNRMLGGVTVKGNMIVHNGNEFSVDPACMGLNMMVTSLLLLLIIIAMYQRKFTRQLLWWQVAGLLAGTFILNVASNLFRIICLVWFNILPGSFMHEVVGICCLLFYVIVPVVWLTQQVIKRYGHAEVTQSGKSTPFSANRVFKIHLVLFLTICWAAYGVVVHDKAVANGEAAIASVEGYKAERITAEIVKLQNSQSLVYMKYIPGFYNADHHPMICWAGSGYLFRQVQQEAIGGQRVYTAVLQNGKDELCTAWWYDNGSQRTIDQLTWRWKVLSGGRPYSVVNVTTGNKQQLLKEVESILRSDKLKPLL